MTFYFFDLETSGFSPRDDRIMQFAGQRTDSNLKLIGDPDNILIKLTTDVLPSPEAVLVTGITPQQTLADGISEAEFCQYFINEIATTGTCFVGFNNLRFDNDFIRFILWRNFYDAYEWAWKNGCSTWDLLDVVRMTRALRPGGIKWPFGSDGQPSNRLELLTSVNKLKHASAHDALSDVNASIDVAKLIKSKQPKLFNYLLNLRDKTRVAALVNKGSPLIYTSGRYPSEFEKTTIAVMVGKQAERSAVFMYDLRIDPDEFKNLSPSELAEKWQLRGKDAPYFPVKTLAYNRCPAIAPLTVLDKETEKRLKLHKEIIDNHYSKLIKIEDFGDKLVEAEGLIKKPYQQELVVDELSVDGSLYNGFVDGSDKIKMRVVRAADEQKLADLALDFSDDRLNLMLPLYKARNYPKSLTAEEQIKWEKYRATNISKKVDDYFTRISELLASIGTNKESDYLLKELQFYGESVLPEM